MFNGTACPASLQSHGSFTAPPERGFPGAQATLPHQLVETWPRQDRFVRQGAPPWDARAPSSTPMDSTATPAIIREDVKTAELSVLRSRMQQMEQEKARMQKELAQARDVVQQNQQLRQMQNDLGFVQRDLVTSEEERKRLQSKLQAAEADIARAKAAPAPVVSILPAAIVVQAPTPVRPVLGTQAPPLESQWRLEVLLRELARWEAASEAAAARGQPTSPPCSDWFVLREAVGRLVDGGAAVFASGRSARTGGMGIGVKSSSAAVDLGAAVASRLQRMKVEQHWSAAGGGARFVQVWVGLCPCVVREMASGPLLDAMADVLHAVVLDRAASDNGSVRVLAVDSSDDRERQECTAQLIDSFSEVASRLRPDELGSLSTVLKRPSLCALLATPPSPGSLHLSCMRFLQAILANPDIFARSHQADSCSNPLLAAANLLVIPCIESGSTGDADRATGRDSPEQQRCRIAALELFCRCLTTAPRVDIVLHLRGAPTVEEEPVDTVLQRVVLLCHHELLCLGIHGHDGGPWNDQALRECAAVRLRAVEHAMMILSSFVWHSAPWAPDMNVADHRSACAAACEALGRTRPLLASIVDVVVRRAAHAPVYERLLASASTLRVLLAHTDEHKQ